MQVSAELTNLYLRLLDAYNTGDVDFMDRYTAHQDGMLVIGTDPAEWWNSHGEFLEAMSVHLKEYREAGLKAMPSNPQAFVDGRVGWLADRTLWQMPDGSIMESRVTAVARWQDGEWKFVQQHFSLGIRNDEVIIQEEEQALAVGA